MSEMELTEKKNRDIEMLEQSAGNSPVRLKALELYPVKPFYMRGENYSPTDLNWNAREAWVNGYYYAINHPIK